jgi:hypothetical protein
MKRATKRTMKRRTSSQVSEFRKAARELGCDESEERFQTALRKLAKTSPKKDSQSL